MINEKVKKTKQTYGSRNPYVGKLSLPSIKEDWNALTQIEVQD
jgi:hypothetical protein